MQNSEVHLSYRYPNYNEETQLYRQTRSSKCLQRLIVNLMNTVFHFYHSLFYYEQF
jgi:hypothetical protein